jgi:hypothetical protein
MLVLCWWCVANEKNIQLLPVLEHISGYFCMLVADSNRPISQQLLVCYKEEKYAAASNLGAYLRVPLSQYSNQTSIDINQHYPTQPTSTNISGIVYPGIAIIQPVELRVCSCTPRDMLKDEDLACTRYIQLKVLLRTSVCWWRVPTDLLHNSCW